jgi:zinc/manganese transport system permease protein
MNFFAVMALPLLACVLLVLILPALGQHVLARGVIFVDLALAQIAALGQSVAFLLGAEPHDPATYYWSFGFTLLGAALFSFLWDREHSVLQEAFIGISFALATAATLLLLANAPHGAEHVSGALSGEALGWVTWRDIAIMATLFAVVGTFLFVNRNKLLLCSENPKRARAAGLSVKKWDFLFYASFGLVVTSSVKVSGVPRGVLVPDRADRVLDAARPPRPGAALLGVGYRARRFRPRRRAVLRQGLADGRDDRVPVRRHRGDRVAVRAHEVRGRGGEDRACNAAGGALARASGRRLNDRARTRAAR